MNSLVKKPMIATRNKSINPQCILRTISQSHETLINPIRALVFVNAMGDMLVQECKWMPMMQAMQNGAARKPMIVVARKTLNSTRKHIFKMYKM